MNTTTSQNKIPRWNLDSLFSSIESPEYKAALADFENGMENLESLLESARNFIKNANENFDFPTWLKGFLESDEKVSALCGTLNAYAYIIYSVDTTNTAYLNNITQIDNLTLRYRQLDLSFKSVLLANSGRLEDFYKRFPEFEAYRYPLNETLEETKHQMSAECEKLAGELQQTGGDAWDRLHEQLISNLKDAETGKTFNELRNDAYSADSATRKSSYEKEIALLRQNEIAFAACLNNLKGETLTLNRHRKWQKALDRSLSSARLSQKTLDALIGAIEESLPMWREYFRLKAEFLHKNAQTVSSDKTDLPSTTFSPRCQKHPKNPGTHFFQKNGLSTKHAITSSNDILPSARRWATLPKRLSTKTGLMPKFAKEKSAVLTTRILRSDTRAAS